MKVYPARDIRPFVMYCVNGKPSSSLLNRVHGLYGYIHFAIKLSCFFLIPSSPGQLYKLRSKRGTTVQVIETAAPHWRKLAYAFNLSSAAVKTIEMESFYQPVKACESALDKWMTADLTDQPVCWARVLQALRDAELTSLASDLERVLMEGIV